MGVWVGGRGVIVTSCTVSRCPMIIGHSTYQCNELPNSKFCSPMDYSGCGWRGGGGENDETVNP